MRKSSKKLPTVKKILAMSIPEIKKAGTVIATGAKLKRELKKRIDKFERGGHGQYANWMKELYDRKRMTSSELSDIVAALRHDASDYDKWQNKFNDLKSKLEDKLTVRVFKDDGTLDEENSKPFKFESDAEVEQFRRFMGAMQKRVGEAWEGKGSPIGGDLFAEAKRLNLNPNQFLRNYEYWMEHVDDLAEAKPLNRKNLKPSDYAKKLGLPKIREWNASNAGRD